MTSRTDIERFIQEELSELDNREPARSFTPGEYRDRLDRLRTAMAEAKIDLLILSSPEAMCWLHGYTARWYKAQSSTRWPPLQCTAVHVDHDTFIQFDMEGHRRLIRLTSVARDVRLWPTRGLDGILSFLVRELKSEGWLGGVTGLEYSSSVPNRAASEALEATLAAEGCIMVDATDVSRKVRRIKSPAEIATIEEAARVCDVGLRALQNEVKPGMTELEAWALLVSAMAGAGGEPAGIHECVVIGPVALGHAISSRRVIKQGDQFWADPCGVVNRYHANTGRHYFVGEPPPEMVEMARIESGAYDLLASVAKPGTRIRDVNKELRDYYLDAGSWGLHAWTGGYELGVSFPPDWVGEWVFSVDEEQPEGVIEAGLVANFESIIAVSMIDTIVFEESGARALSGVPREVLTV